MGLLISEVYASRAPNSSLHPLAEHPRTALEHSASVDAFRAAMLFAAALAFAATGISNQEALEQAAPEPAPVRA